MAQEQVNPTAKELAAPGLLTPTQALKQKFQLPEIQTSTPPLPKKKFPRFSFAIGDINFTIHTRNICAVSEIMPIYKLPNTQRWLRGVANIRGYIVPVFDLADYLDLHTDSNSKNQKLLISGEQENSAAILIEGLPAHQTFTEDEVHMQLPPVPARLRMYLQGAFSRKRMLWLDIDYENLLLAAAHAAM